MARRTHEPSALVPSSFLALSAVGFTLLWVVMAFNGTLVALLQSAWRGTFADGKPLRTSYTRIFPVDFAISVLVAFFDDQINTGDQGTWILMANFLVMLQAPALWIFIEAGRTQRTPNLLKLHFLWPLLWNLFGAALILPLYFYYFVTFERLGISGSPVSNFHSSNAIPIIAIVGYLPAAILLSIGRFVTVPWQQAITACCLLVPLFLATAGPSKDHMAGKIHGQSDRVKNSIRVQQAYILTGIISALTHIYILRVTTLNPDPGVEFGRIFVPHSSMVVSGAVDNIHQGALLFLQYDWIVVNTSCALWIFFIVQQNNLLAWAGRESLKIVLIVLATMLVGPGAAGSGALWLREQTFVEEHNLRRE